MIETLQSKQRFEKLTGRRLSEPTWRVKPEAPQAPYQDSGGGEPRKNQATNTADSPPKIPAGIEPDYESMPGCPECAARKAKDLARVHKHRSKPKA